MHEADLVYLKLFVIILQLVQRDERGARYLNGKKFNEISTPWEPVASSLQLAPAAS